MKIINILFLLTLITEANAQSIEALKNARFSNERQRNPSLKESNIEPIKNVTNERKRNPAIKYEKDLAPIKKPTMEKQ